MQPRRRTTLVVADGVALLILSNSHGPFRTHEKKIVPGPPFFLLFCLGRASHGTTHPTSCRVGRVGRVGQCRFLWPLFIASLCRFLLFPPPPPPGLPVTPSPPVSSPEGKVGRGGEGCWTVDGGWWIVDGRHGQRALFVLSCSLSLSLSGRPADVRRLINSNPEKGAPSRSALKVHRSPALQRAAIPVDCRRSLFLVLPPPPFPFLPFAISSPRFDN